MDINNIFIMDKFIISTKISCDIEKFLCIRNYMSNQNQNSDPFVLKINYNIFKGHLDIEVETANRNIFN